MTKTGILIGFGIGLAIKYFWAGVILVALILLLELLEKWTIKNQKKVKKVGR